VLSTLVTQSRMASPGGVLEGGGAGLFHGAPGSQQAHAENVEAWRACPSAPMLAPRIQPEASADVAVATPCWPSASFSNDPLLAQYAGPAGAKRRCDLVGAGCGLGLRASAPRGAGPPRARVSWAVSPAQLHRRVGRPHVGTSR